MTILVGIQCNDGVVIGADGSVTLSHGNTRTIEQPTKRKMEIVEQKVIVASSGQLGLGQRFHDIVKQFEKRKGFQNKTALAVGKDLSRAGIEDFQSTALRNYEINSLIAYAVYGKPALCELAGSTGFQPELKEVNNQWFTSTGSGQPIVDPFLGFLRSVFWKTGAPSLREGIFMALWALRHACEVNPGGINEPISISVLEKTGRDYRARYLSEDELQETREHVASLTSIMFEYREKLLGDSGTSEVPN